MAGPGQDGAAVQLARRAVVAGSLVLVMVIALIVVVHPETQRRLELLSGNSALTPAIVRDLGRLQQDLAKAKQTSVGGSVRLQLQQQEQQQQQPQWVVQPASREDETVDHSDLLSRVDETTPLQRLDLATHDLLHKWLRVDDARASTSYNTESRLQSKARELRQEASRLDQHASDLARESEWYDQQSQQLRRAARQPSSVSTLNSQPGPKLGAASMDSIPQPLSYLESNPEKAGPVQADTHAQSSRRELVGGDAVQMETAKKALKAQYDAKVRALKHLYDKQKSLLVPANNGPVEVDEQSAQDAGIPAVNPQLEGYTYSPTMREAYAANQQLFSPMAKSQELSLRSHTDSAKRLRSEDDTTVRASTTKLTWPRPAPSDTPRGAFKDNTIYDPDYNWPSKVEVERGDEWEEKGDCGLWGGNC
mmetsp:Transcript_35407/g.55280  ORF Transcript_35407/g.55280 Transcript_35407/m.55280 type:complete len:421 (+) Transcript_35407:95-1357(+)